MTPPKNHDNRYIGDTMYKNMSAHDHNLIYEVI